ncbi:MAG: FAD-binding oxidoreductase [Sphingomicrobium sp.]
MSKFDVVIVGGGIAGASLGARIAARARVAIIEAEPSGAVHATGRSAAFWLAHYGGSAIVPLTVASRAALEAGWPSGGRSWLSPRGAVTIARNSIDLRDAPSAETVQAPRRTQVGRAQLEALVPGLLPGWDFGLVDETCADIDVAALHHGCLAAFARLGGTLLTSTPLVSARRDGAGWHIHAGDSTLTAATIVDAAGAWADDVAGRCGVAGLGIRPFRRTIAQVRVGHSGLRALPLVLDALGTFYFKGEGDNRLWVSPHDEGESIACDTAPEELDVADALERLQSVVPWPIEAVERTWAGLRSFTPWRTPAIGFDSQAPGFFWCAGQGGFGIQTAPAVSAIAAGLLLGEEPDSSVSHIDATAFAPRCAA